MVDESFEAFGFGEALKMRAGLTEALTETLDVANEEPASDRRFRSTPRVKNITAGVCVGQVAPSESTSSSRTSASIRVRS